VVFVYFAGQGVEVNHRSLFPAVDSKGDSRSVVEESWFDVNEFVARLSAVSRVRIVIMDFCRDDPFRSVAGR
jgi:uncharacterized caspase-like protein